MNTPRNLFNGLFPVAVVTAVVLFAAIPAIHAQNVETPVEHGTAFVDVDGDGYNDAAPDADGDGIPNGQDSDYTRNATTAGNGHGHKFVDEDGDGFNDNAPDADGDGIPNGQDSDYTPQGQASRHQGENSQNGSGVKNAFGADGKGAAHRNGKCAATGSYGAVKGAGGAARGNGAGMRTSQGGK